MKTLLFICTGNYYRSRFAETFFNHRAKSENLDWLADSRGVGVDRPGNGNVGPISRHALEALKECGIDVELRYPKQVTVEDLQRASRIIALKEAEHRPMIARRYREWENVVEYWHVHDLDQATSDIALPEIKDRVNCVIQSIKSEQKFNLPG